MTTVVKGPSGFAPAVFWFTGLPGSGKTSISTLVGQELRACGAGVAILDGDNLRRGLNRNLGYDRESRRESVRRTGEIALLLASQGLICLCALIAPFREDRDQVRKLLGPLYHEVYLDCPVEICAARDPKGHYARARRKEIPDFTGVGGSYEPPHAPELILHTGGESMEDSLQRAMAYVLARIQGVLPGLPSSK